MMRLLVILPLFLSLCQCQSSTKCDGELERVDGDFSLTDETDLKRLVCLKEVTGNLMIGSVRSDVDVAPYLEVLELPALTSLRPQTLVFATAAS